MIDIKIYVIALRLNWMIKFLDNAYNSLRKEIEQKNCFPGGCDLGATFQNKIIHKRKQEYVPLQNMQVSVAAL